jgi:hypothetical protein
MEHPAVALVVFVFVAFLWAFFVWPYRRYRLALLRQRLFDLRDELFEYAKDHSTLEFEDPAYGITRTRINGMLRLAHDFSLASFLAIFFAMRSMSAEERQLIEQHERRREEALSRLDEDAARYLQSVLYRANFQVLVYVLHTSLLFGPLMHGTKSLARAIKGVARLCESAVRWTASTPLVRTFEAEAEIVGADFPPLRERHAG